MQFIDLQAQYQRIKPDVDARIHAVLDHGRYIMGPEVEALEQRLAEYVGVQHCVALSSGTDALLAAMMALEIGPGDEVITTPFTFVATGEMIGLLGATPIFVDIDGDTYNLDSAQIESRISRRTRAILPVSLFGQIADMDPIIALGAKYDIPVIEDAAQSFGATYKQKRSGAVSMLAATSFFPAKPLGCYGDGGAVFTSNAELAGRIRELRNHGQSAPYQHARLGINGRLDTLQAAVLLAKMQVFDDEIARRQEIAARYAERLAGAIKIPYIAVPCTSVYAQYTIEVEQRDAVRRALNDAGVPTAIYYPVPLHRQPPLYSDVTLPSAEAAAERVVSLPMHPYLDPATQDRICDALLQAIENTRGDAWQAHTTSL